MYNYLYGGGVGDVVKLPTINPNAIQKATNIKPKTRLPFLDSKPKPPSYKLNPNPEPPLDLPPLMHLSFKDKFKEIIEDARTNPISIQPESPAFTNPKKELKTSAKIAWETPVSTSPIVSFRGKY